MMWSKRRSGAMSYMPKVPNFELVATSTDSAAPSSAASFTSTLASLGVVTPRFKSQELALMKARSVLSLFNVSAASRPTVDRLMWSRRPPV